MSPMGFVPQIITSIAVKSEHTIRMLRIVQQTSAAAAKSYFSTADYFHDGQETLGHWHFGDGVFNDQACRCLYK